MALVPQSLQVNSNKALMLGQLLAPDMKHLAPSLSSQAAKASSPLEDLRVGRLRSAGQRP